MTTALAKRTRKKSASRKTFGRKKKIEKNALDQSLGEKEKAILQKLAGHVITSVRGGGPILGNMLELLQGYGNALLLGGPEQPSLP